jgi:hypothetical protein
MVSLMRVTLSIRVTFSSFLITKSSLFPEMSATISEV